MASNNKRLLSLDILRGITVAGMILVNNGGGKLSYITLHHSKWNGLTPCDLVFPFFLFIVGISTYLSLSKTGFRMTKPTVVKILKRTILLFLIGLAINWFDLACGGDMMPFDKIRIWGVLQRIAICYCAVSFFAITANHRYTLPAIAALLIIYTVILIIGNGYAYDETNILAIADRHLFGYAHLYHKSPVDPEGLLSTIPSIAHTLIGFYCCKMMMQVKDVKDKALAFLFIGSILVIGGYLLSFGLPLNKRVWSPSYVLMTCGLASLLQGILVHLIDINHWKSWTKPFLIFGVNPLFLYVMSEVVAIIFSHIGAKNAIYNGINSIIPDAYAASAVYALLFVVLCGLVGLLLHHKKIYIKL